MTGVTPAEVERLVRLRRLVVWRIDTEHWRLCLGYCEAKADKYQLTEWRGKPAVLTNDILFIEGR